MLCCMWIVFLFFNQKTAYEMRISDWSSDVCSSDLICANANTPHTAVYALRRAACEIAVLKEAVVICDEVSAWRGSGVNDAGRVLRAARCSADRKRVGSGKSVAGRVSLGGRRCLERQADGSTMVTLHGRRNRM